MDQDIVQWLLVHYGQEKFHPGLERISLVLKPLLPLFKDTKIVTVAGTNGKGETILRLSRLLESESHGVWTSPHIERITERFRTESGEISLSELKSLIFSCHEQLERDGQRLTYYEFLFYVFCVWMSEKNPKYLLLEVGLGGRLDAVNCLDADLVLLPSISRDHQEFLGNRYDGILQEKLGVLRPGKTLISYLHLRYLRERAQTITRSRGATLIDLAKLELVAEFDFSGRNKLLAAAAFKILSGMPETQMMADLESGQWPVGDSALEHRGEILQEKNEWLFFGSHNTDGLRKLIQFLHSGTYTFSRPPFDAVMVSFSQRDPRDLQAMFKMLKKARLGEIIITTFPHPKAAAGSLLRELAVQEGLKFVEDGESYFKDQSSCRFLVVGSYYFLGYLKSRIRGHLSSVLPRG